MSETGFLLQPENGQGATQGTDEKGGQSRRCWGPGTASCWAVCQSREPSRVRGLCWPGSILSTQSSSH